MGLLGRKTWGANTGAKATRLRQRRLNYIKEKPSAIGVTEFDYGTFCLAKTIDSYVMAGLDPAIHFETLRG